MEAKTLVFKTTHRWRRRRDLIKALSSFIACLSVCLCVCVLVECAGVLLMTDALIGLLFFVCSFACEHSRRTLSSFGTSSGWPNTFAVSTHCLFLMLCIFCRLRSRPSLSCSLSQVVFILSISSTGLQSRAITVSQTLVPVSVRAVRDGAWLDRVLCIKNSRLAI